MPNLLTKLIVTILRINKDASTNLNSMLIFIIRFYENTSVCWKMYLYTILFTFTCAVSFFNLRQTKKITYWLRVLMFFLLLATTQERCELPPIVVTHGKVLEI